MFLGFQGLHALGGLLPLGLARAAGRGVGALAYACLGAQRRLTEEHLRYAYGDSVEPAERRRIARAVFVNLGQTALEWMRLPRTSLETLSRWVTAEGVAHIREALAKGRGAIMVSGHFGNWELMPLYLKSLGFEGGVLARRLRKPEYESFLITMRERKGVTTLARDSLKDVARVLRANQIIGMMPDQDISSLEGVFIDFFGHPAYTPVGPAALALMTGAPIIPCFLIRDGARYRFVVEPPVAIPPTAGRAEAIAALTQAWSRVVETYIRRYPEQWVWMHRRWKTQPKEAASAKPPAASPAPAQGPGPAVRPALALAVAACSLWLVAALAGCGKPAKPSTAAPAVAADPATTPELDGAQEMRGFTLTGYEVDGSKHWEMHGQGANVEDGIVTIHHPDAVGYDLTRTAHLTASVANVRQSDRHVRLEHDVTIHTSDGLWLTSPILYWIPDQNQMATDQPVRVETDHMLIRGRGASGLTQLKHASILEDVEVVLNPTDEEPAGGPQHVTITCDGPLTFDYDNNIATFERNVHVRDPSGDLYSDKLIAYLNPDSHTIRYAEAVGQVRVTQAKNTALSERAVYEPAQGKITLVGRPSLLIYPDQPRSSPLAFGGLVASAPDAKAPPALAAGAQ